MVDGAYIGTCVDQLLQAAIDTIKLHGLQFALGALGTLSYLICIIFNFGIPEDELAEFNSNSPIDK